jgi:hypothetical protein
MRYLLCIALMVTLAAAICAAQVTVSSPTSGATVTSPVKFVASATSTTSGYPITAMRIYVDSVSMYTVYAASLNTTLSPTAGAHTVVVVAWDASGKSYNKSLPITVVNASASSASATGQVAVSSPTSGATVASPVKFVASATSNSGSPITAMRIYIDSVNMYTVNAASLNTSLSPTAGPHTVTFVAWDASGKSYTNALNITVSSATASTTASAFDSYPATASVMKNMENTTWDSCNCGGTGAAPAGESLAAGKETVYGGSSGISGWLWYTPFASTNSGNWIMDYDVTPLNLTGAVALEFDGNQTGSLGNFVFGTECNYGYNPSMKTVWRFWTMSGGHETWGTTNYACPITQVNHTYHVQIHFVASTGSYRVARVKVTDLTTGAVVQDQSNLGTFSAVGSHGSSIDIQGDVEAGSTIAAQYKNISIIRW